MCSRKFVCIELFLILIFLIPNLSSGNVETSANGTVRVFLYEKDTGSERTGNNMIYASFGDTISIDLFIRNPFREPVTSLSFYMTVDDKYFDVVNQDVDAEDELIPFIQGTYMSNSVPIVYNNSTFGDVLSADDNNIPGWQLDYVEQSQFDITGRLSSQRQFGTVCSFQLVAKAPGDSISIQFDDTHFNNRFGRYSVIDGGTYFYEKYETCYISISGIEINPPLPDIFMEPDNIDTSLDLDDHIGLASIPDSLLLWTASGNTNIGAAIDSTTHVVTFTAPDDYQGYEDIVFTVTSSDGMINASDTTRVTVDDSPVLLADIIRDKINNIHEDSLEVVLSLRDIVEDSDDAFENLTWYFTTGGNVTSSVISDSLALKGIQDFYGSDTLTLSVYDTYGIGDSLSVPVQVLPVPDRPVLSDLPDITMERGESYQLLMSDYMSDADGDQLTLTWNDTANLLINLEGYQVTIKSETFIGSEQLTFTVTDPQGLSASSTMLVTVIAAKNPPVWSFIPKIGFAQGSADSSLFLWDFVADPDDADSLLTFQITNDDDIDKWEINSNDGRLYLWDLDNIPGWDRLMITATDSGGNMASTQLLVFIAPADGTPIVAGIPDTTIVADTEGEWVDLDDFYYDIDNTDIEMDWTWARLISPDSTVTVSINPLSRIVTLKSFGKDLTGYDRIIFTVTDPGGKFSDDVCIVTVVEDISEPSLNLPAKVGFVAGEEAILDLDDYVEDQIFSKSELAWLSFLNDNSIVTFETPDNIRTRPVSFTGSSDWIGWERVEFIVSNPLGGAAKDTLLVFSVSVDGVPVVGGLEGISLRAGECTSVDLDDYYFDADTPDTGMTWTVSGYDSITVSMYPSTHIATVCAPSETWEGEEMLNFTVTDSDNNSTPYNVLVTVTDAVVRNVFSVMIYRNPMQEDYMDFYVTSKEDLKGLPSVDVKMETDSTQVSVETVSAGYYYGIYLLPLGKSLGVKGVADVIIGGTLLTGKTVQDTTRFAYGRVDITGAKIALGPMTLDIPEGALAKPVLVTVVPGGDIEAAMDRELPDEVILSSESFTVGPLSLAPEKPVSVGFSVGTQTVGPGVYHLENGRWNFIGARRIGGYIHAEADGGGTFSLGFDATPPRLKLVDAGDGSFAVKVADYGSGIDEGSITVIHEGAELPFEYDPVKSIITVSGEDIGFDSSPVFEVAVSDNSGNRKTESFTAESIALPGRISLEQNRPNPFNPITHITFEITSDTMINLVVYDLLGRKVRVLANGRFAAGRHTLTWDARDDSGRTVSSGAYIYRVSSDARSITRKMLLIR